MCEPQGEVGYKCSNQCRELQLATDQGGQGQAVPIPLFQGTDFQMLENMLSHFLFLPLPPLPVSGINTPCPFPHIM